jgi:hypothetical protein
MNPTVLRQGLNELSLSLRHLHGTLLRIEQRRHEEAHGTVTPAELLRLALSEPRFAWLRELSGLIVEIDERTSDDRAVGHAEAVSFRSRAEKRIGPGPGKLSEQLLSAVQESPDVAIGLGRLRLALAALPVAGQVLA